MNPAIRTAATARRGPPFIRPIWMGWRFWRAWSLSEASYYGWHLIAQLGPLVLCIRPERKGGRW